jgi:hypothetical protein
VVIRLSKSCCGRGEGKLVLIACIIAVIMTAVGMGYRCVIRLNSTLRMSTAVAEFDILLMIFINAFFVVVV